MKTKQIIVTLLLTFLINVGGAFAQIEVAKGLRLPHFTTAQRDALDTRATSARSGGLLIYNMDNNCVEYWNENEKAWISLCGVVNPEMDVPLESCSKIRVHGRYFKGAQLDNSHFITMPVTVIQPGTYTLTVQSNNGYFFHTSGVFVEPGVYDLTLVGMGAPTENQTDQLVFSVNGTEIAKLCTNVTVEVIELTMGYRIDCFDVQVIGYYRVNRYFLDEDNHVIVPVEVLALGTTTIRTDRQNGIRFSGTKEFTALGPDTIVLFVDGIAQQEGDFRYYFTTDGDVRTTCQFSVSFVSLLGTYEEPACNCAQIAQERPFAPNGEYWVRDCSFIDPNASEDDDVTDNTPRFRTYCDISGGGWMLVWSYSERTARNTYIQSTATGGIGNSNTMVIGGEFYRPNVSRPINIITSMLPDGSDYDDPHLHRVPHRNFRLPLAMWQVGNAENGRQEQIRIRIATDSINMRDVWAANNFVVMTPISTALNPIRTNWPSAGGNRVPSAGRIFGVRFEVRQVGGSTASGGGWAEIGGNRRIRVVNANTPVGFHFNFDRGGSTAFFQVRPDLNGGGAANQLRMADMANMFGVHSTGTTTGSMPPNHHFGKCGSDDFSFSVVRCPASSMVPHSFNNGEGRYMQWWVR